MIRNVSRLKSLLDLFPLHDDISYCFAYGSAIFQQSLERSKSSKISTLDQKTNNSSKNMIDLVLSVKDPSRWHKENLAKNWSHYSGLKYLGPSSITNIQKKFGAKVYYNTLVPVDKDVTIKYGIISDDDFINDLLDWETLYLSGRLHKPVLVLHQNESLEANVEHSIRLQNALNLNRQSALHTALLLLPEKFTSEQLYMAIASLSYSGDFRMWFGEDRSKVEKIVRPQIRTFHHIYSPLIRSDLFSHLVQWSDKDECFQQILSHNSIQWHMNLLPKTVQYHIGRRWLLENTSRRYQVISKASVHRFDIDDLMRTVSNDVEYRRYIRRAIQWIVFKSSTMQTIKGFFTAGPTKSVIYSANKLQKMFKSLRSSKKQEHFKL